MSYCSQVCQADASDSIKLFSDRKIILSNPKLFIDSKRTERRRLRLKIVSCGVRIENACGRVSFLSDYLKKDVQAT